MAAIESNSILFLTPDDVAERLNFSRSMIYKLISQGDLPASKIGKSVRVHIRDLEEWAERKRPTNS